MTAIAGVWRIIVITIVTIGTVKTGMCPVQLVITVMNREGGRLPAGGRGMAHRTIRWDDQDNVIWIQTCVVIWGMAAFTGIGRVVVIPMVTSIAIVGNGYVRSGEGVD